MADEAEQDCPECPAGIPAWVPTFADLMSLLMCFFVLLLSFSEMDALKFKRLAGSMREAFGVQTILNVTDIPKGTSIIAQEFSPGRPDPTPINEIFQKTDNEIKSSLEVACQDQGFSNAGEKGDAAELLVVDKIKELVGETEDDALALAEALKQQIVEGELEVETSGRKIIVRIKEQGAFASGSDALNTSFTPVLDTIRDVLADTPGEVSVEGHTDNIPVLRGRFSSNWALSSARAVSVAHALFEDGLLNSNRFSVKGYADARPLTDNDSSAGRSRNRRVELVITQGVDKNVEEKMRTLKESNPELYQELRDQLESDFKLRAEEIF